MQRSDLILRLVLVEISDDYENVDQIILKHVSARTAKCGVLVERADIVDALTKLVNDGLANAYHLPNQHELGIMPSLDVIEEDFATYFLRTKKGLEFHRSDSTWWPFDAEDNLLPDWQLERC